MKVFVSGCFDLLHSGHMTFLKEAAKLGDLYVSIGSDKTIRELKKRDPIYTQDERKFMLENLGCVKEVFIGSGSGILDFTPELEKVKPDIFFVNSDGDSEEKRNYIKGKGIQYIVMERVPEMGLPVRSTTDLRKIIAKDEDSEYSPLRVDFAGGWLDTPGMHRTNGFVVNCSISPLVSKKNWRYSQRSGLGGSSAWAFINALNPFKYDMEHGNGWQDSAIVLETGCCVWHSGDKPVLDFKNTGDFLKGKMAIWDTNIPHDTQSLSQKERDIEKIKEISRIARIGVLNKDVHILSLAANLTYQEQLKEGMQEVPFLNEDGVLGAKYCGSGHGGYVLYTFETEQQRTKIISKHKGFIPIEPYCRLFGQNHR
ncbi:MAG: adenylyltransferase/cytidyltransferase family protein [Alphaproteobacteria bacterium]|nr:adenylyltransferase/cytidyltransferase family protein [Alphaproteobacteria bacterium]